MVTPAGTPDCGEEPRLVGLLPGEPSGVIVTRTAAVGRFRAALFAGRPQELSLPAPLDSARRTLEGGTLRLEKRVLAPTEGELGVQLGALMRAAAECAALSGSVLEASVVRDAPPRVASRTALEALARDLWSAGFALRFATCAAPPSVGGAADVWVGSGGGRGGALREFLLSHPRWETARVLDERALAG